MGRAVIKVSSAPDKKAILEIVADEKSVFRASLSLAEVESLVTVLERQRVRLGGERAIPSLPIFEMLTLLTPYDIDKPKTRIGTKRDGGYVLADDFHGQTILSYGIATEISFEMEMAQRGHRIFMFDHTVEALPAMHSNFRFFKEGIAATSDPGRSLFSLQDHMQRHDVREKHMVLKMDVEGAEWSALNSSSPEVLAHFDQIVMEVHNLTRVADQALLRLVGDVLAKLNEQFTLFHVHANNVREVAVVEGFVVPDLLEVSYVRTSTVKRQRSRTVYPTDLDYPNVRGCDIPMLFYPFLPIQINADELKEAIVRIGSRKQ